MRTWADFGIDVPSRASGEYSTTCPECSRERKKKKAKCLSVNVTEGVWHCQHCGWSGTLKGGTRSTDIHWARPDWRKPDPEIARQTDLPQKVVDWFAGRGIPESVLARNQIIAAEVYMPQVEGHVQAVGFPMFRDGEVVNIKWRDGRKNFRLETGCERIPYGLDDVAEERTWIWVEGEIDKLAMEVAGFTNVVSVPTGAPTPGCKEYSSKFDYLTNAAAQIDKAACHVIAVDEDEPGNTLADELTRRLGREKCKRVGWPRGCKDAADTLLSGGESAIQDAVVGAKDVPVYGVFDVVDQGANIERLYQYGYEKGVSTGYDNMEGVWSVRPGELTILTGIPSSGKSNWLDDLLVNLSRLHGWHHAIFSPENQPLEDHMARMIEKYLRKPFNDGPTPRMDEIEMREGMHWLNQHMTWMLPGDDSLWTLDYILESAKALVYRKGIRTMVIDPWNELEHHRPRDQSETEYISHSLKKIRQFGRQHGVHMFVVAHPAKLHKNQDGQYNVPTLYDISGSAHWRNKADNGICIWRDFVNDARAIEIHVQKVRFRQIGRIEVVRMRYQTATGHYIAA